MNETLHVVTSISNTNRYRSRYELYREFEPYVLNSGGDLYTVEMAFGDRPHEVTVRTNPKHLQLFSSTELWHKENMINLGVARLPSDWKYVAWIDADVSFTRHDWVKETLHQLQHYDVVQMFEDAYDLAPPRDSKIIGKAQGFAASYVNGRKEMPSGYYGGHFWHPGYAWACTRRAWETMGGLIDWAILGAGDHHISRALIGEVQSSYHKGCTLEYKKTLHVWQEHALELKKNIGYVPGSLLHRWHGPKAARGYRTRWQILVDNQFNPHTDIKKDSQGLYQLTLNKIKLRDELREYFRSRNEDAI